MDLNQIHHVAIITRNYEKAKHFYTEILGLPIIREVYREERDSYKLDLQVGSSEIELFSFPDPPERPNSPEAAGLRHLCFAVPDLDNVIEELEAKGVAVEPVRVDPHTGERYTFFKDPDELPLELKEVR